MDRWFLDLTLSVCGICEGAVRLARSQIELSDDVKIINLGVGEDCSLSLGKEVDKYISDDSNDMIDRGNLILLRKSIDSSFPTFPHTIFASSQEVVYIPGEKTPDSEDNSQAVSFLESMTRPYIPDEEWLRNDGIVHCLTPLRKRAILFSRETIFGTSPIADIHDDAYFFRYQKLFPPFPGKQVFDPSHR